MTDTAVSWTENVIYLLFQINKSIIKDFTIQILVFLFAIDHYTA